ncbi:MAG TPA: NAD(P)H-dependent oxidoreductase [Candidatus Acidoferrales bacterium]|nr:NAD(P)H-dependent oxidoreductase [Candidatus Acidoferrales bacterium]
MKISLILAHPNPASFNHAIAKTAEAELQRLGHNVRLHDLCQEQFNPLLPLEELAKTPILGSVIRQHCHEIVEADGIIIVHPNWWGMPPAILKGWLDRVLRMEVAYRFIANDQGEGVPQGLLKAQSAIVFNTANTPEDRERECFGDPLETLWKRCVFDLCGVKKVERRTFSVVITSTFEQRTRWLAEVRKVVGAHFPAEKRTQTRPTAGLSSRVPA